MMVKEKSRSVDNTQPGMYHGLYRMTVTLSCGCDKIFYSPVPEKGDDLLCQQHGEVVALKRKYLPHSNRIRKDRKST